jgi:hypothetical protein
MIEILNSHQRLFFYCSVWIELSFEEPSSFYLTILSTDELSSRYIRTAKEDDHLHTPSLPNSLPSRLFFALLVIFSWSYRTPATIERVCFPYSTPMDI